MRREWQTEFAETLSLFSLGSIHQTDGCDQRQPAAGVVARKSLAETAFTLFP